MKKIRLVLLAVTLGLASFSAIADDDRDKDDKNKTGHSSTTAIEMSLFGLGAASLLGGGAYLAYRRRVKARS
jgi:hypothetical protein